jgi:hypothetical protein
MRPETDLLTDLASIRAQVEDGVPWRDGVLTYNQAMALLKEVERLRTAVAERNLRITQLIGIMS